MPATCPRLRIQSCEQLLLGTWAAIFHDGVDIQNTSSGTLATVCLDDQSVNIVGRVRKSTTSKSINTRLLTKLSIISSSALISILKQLNPTHKPTGKTNALHNSSLYATTSQTHHHAFFHHSPRRRLSCCQPLGSSRHWKWHCT